MCYRCSCLALADCGREASVLWLDNFVLFDLANLRLDARQILITIGCTFYRPEGVMDGEV